MKPSMKAKIVIEIVARYDGEEFQIMDGEIEIPVSFKLAPLDAEAVRVTVETGGINASLATALEGAAAELRGRA